MNQTVTRLAAPAPWPHYADDEVDAVTAVLRSGKVNYWTGDLCREFEREYARHAETKHAVAVANGTVALELALHAFGIGAGDEVITPSRTYIASASCAVTRGAVPIVVDVDPVTQNISPAAIRAAITPRTKAIIAVHLGGWPCDMDEIMAIAEQHGIKVIEDCAQAHGAMYKGRPVGGLGHAAAFSFCQDKIITTGGEGGMLTTNDTEAWEKAWAYKDIGRSYDAVYRREHPPGFRWLTDTFGTNWRLTEMQAAIGLRQLAKLRDWTESRCTHAAALTAGLKDLPLLRLTLPDEEIGHAYYRYYAFVRPENLAEGWSRDRIIAELNALGVPAFSGSCSEIYLEKAFDGQPGKPSERLPVAKELGETSLMFLVHPTLTADWMAQAIELIRAVLQKATA